jgi:hypothetical protein
MGLRDAAAKEEAFRSDDSTIGVLGGVADLTRNESAQEQSLRRD